MAVSGSYIVWIAVAALVACAGPPPRGAAGGQAGSPLPPAVAGQPAVGTPIGLEQPAVETPRPVKKPANNQPDKRVAACVDEVKAALAQNNSVLASERIENCPGLADSGAGLLMASEAALAAGDQDLAESWALRAFTRTGATADKARALAICGDVRVKNHDPDAAAELYAAALRWAGDPAVEKRRVALAVRSTVLPSFTAVSLSGPIASLARYCRNTSRKIRAQLDEDFTCACRVSHRLDKPGAPYREVALVTTGCNDEYSTNAYIDLAVRTRAGWFIDRITEDISPNGKRCNSNNIFIDRFAALDAVPGGAPEIVIDYRRELYCGGGGLDKDFKWSYTLVAGVGSKGTPGRIPPILLSARHDLLDSESDEMIRVTDFRFTASFSARGELSISGSPTGMRKEIANRWLGDHTLQFP